MKITKKQLSSIIKEARMAQGGKTLMSSRANPDFAKAIKNNNKKTLREWGESEISSPLINFARAYRGLGDAVASQVDQIVGAYLDGDNETFLEAVYEVNPNAIDTAMRKLQPILRYGELGDEGDVIQDALSEAQKVFQQGDAEVEADREAAGDY